MLGRLPVFAALVVTVTAGCISPAAPLDAAGLPPVGVPALVSLLEERGGFEVEVPVPVVLIGFDDGVAEALQAALTPASVDHDFLDAYNSVANPQYLVDPPADLYTNPALPKARYEVRALPAAEAQHYLDYILGLEVEAENAPYTLYDGRALEDHLAERLAARADTPMLVILHGGDVLPAEHGWRYTYETGWLDRVRIFGGRQPLLVLDASAQPDPYVVRPAAATAPVTSVVFGQAPPPAAYNFPLERGGADTVEALAQAATDAAHFRLVQGPIYPNAIRPCHTVLAYIGVRATALVPRIASLDGLVDTAVLTSGFGNLTGAPVTVEARVVMLPQDDPALDAATRNDLNYDLFRTWADMNWGTFFEDDGCEHYLNTLVVTDATEGVHGIALMDVERNRRISFSWVDDEAWLRESDDSPAAGTPLFSRPASREASRWGTFLVAHEGGHLFGQTHPHNAIRDQDVEGERAPAFFTFAFSATWDAMSYQSMDRVADFGAIPAANYQRNRAGFAVGAAMEQGLQESPEFQAAMAHLARYDWKAAADALVPALQP